MNSVWVLTRSINNYNQEGAYFVAVFRNKPTREQLLKYNVPDRFVERVLNGGPETNEYEWWDLEETPFAT